LVDGMTHATLATTTATLATSSAATLTANPDPILVAPGAAAGETTLSWNAPGSGSVEVHVGSATGALFAEGGSTGSAQTGDWVSNGLVFVLVDGMTHATLTTTMVTNTAPHTWYVDSNSGSDSNNGRSPTSAFQTGAKVMSVVQSGQNVGLECHGMWFEQWTVPTTEVTLDVYGVSPCGSSMPLIDGTTTIKAGSWSLTGATLTAMRRW
jgi:hypothetical protein